LCVPPFFNEATFTTICCLVAFVGAIITLVCTPMTKLNKEINQRFIEASEIGTNHQLGRNLLEPENNTP